ncbi:MAG: MFS transporter [Chloroflexota bacterium]|uniref:Major facilitator superfamily (MFS) profile domain-containing protein n=1 Tax=marine metagenome TaxID=408172 RepID=A0A381QMD6_9ZZZZ|nr:MFS transporter [Chloroflexota bacterium]
MIGREFPGGYFHSSDPMLQRFFNWRLRTPFYYGWLVLAISFVATFAASGLTQVVLGGVQVYITEESGWDDGSLAFAATLGTWLSGMIAPVIGRLADRFGPRWLMPFGLIVAGIAFFVIAGSNSVVMFYGGYVVGRAVSNPVLVGLVPRTAAVNFFRQRRNIALALVSTFRPIAGAINIQIISLIAVHQGWRAAYRYLGVLSLVLILPVMLFVRRRPEDIGLLPDGANPDQLRAETGNARPQPLTTEFSWTAKEAIRTRAFWLLLGITALGTLASSATGFSLVPFLVQDAGLSTVSAAGVLSLGTFLAVANLFWGYLADRITPRRCLIVMMIGAGAMMAFLLSVDSVGEALLFAVIWGVFSGGLGSLENMVLAGYFGRGSYGTILGVFSPLQMIALGAGPALASTVRSLTGDFYILYVAMGVAYFVSAVLMFIAKPPRRPARAEAKTPGPGN